MKPSLQLQTTTQMVLTPQLQQAIRLLQLSSIELQTELRQLLLANPFLDIAENPDIELPEDDQPLNHETLETVNTDNFQSTAESISPAYTTAELPTSFGSFDPDDEEAEDYPLREPTLGEHLCKQMQLAPFTELERIIAILLIDGIDEQGYLKISLPEVLEQLHTIVANQEISLEEIEAVLKRIQFFDPPGVGACDLQECLLLQIQQYPTPCRWLKTAQTIVQDHFTALSQKQYSKIQRSLLLKEEELKLALDFLRTLNPRPGNQITATVADMVIPDVLVRKVKDQWVVELNELALPKIHLNHHYIELSRSIRDPAQSHSVRTQLQEARWLIKSIQNRHETLLKVATSIVRQQLAFFENGPEAFLPLTLHTIAEDVEMHESTISRVTTHKYMLTPQGIFELKYFFSSQIQNSAGESVAGKAIQAKIRSLIENEDVRKPFSDDKIAQLLGDQGYQVARRTIAKYREQLRILPSSERRQIS